jgi:hypothetical protein
MTGFTRLASSTDVEAPLSGVPAALLCGRHPFGYRSGQAARHYTFLVEQFRLAVARSAG